MMAYMDRQKAIDAVDILNDFIGDLITGVMVLRVYIGEDKAGRMIIKQMVSLQKMCLSYIVLTLAKWLEFYDKYQSFIPNEHRNEVRVLNKRLKDMRIKEFRNKCIGHIWDNDYKRPLMHSEIMKRLNVIIENNLEEFLRWVNDPQNNVYPNTIISIVESIRDSVISKYRIKGSEVINR